MRTVSTGKLTCSVCVLIPVSLLVRDTTKHVFDKGNEGAVDNRHIVASCHVLTIYTSSRSVHSNQHPKHPECPHTANLTY